MDMPSGEAREPTVASERVTAQLPRGRVRGMPTLMRVRRESATVLIVLSAVALAASAGAFYAADPARAALLLVTGITGLGIGVAGDLHANVTV